MLPPEENKPNRWPRRWLDAWRDRRLHKMHERAFCRRVHLEGWEHIASAVDSRRGLLIAVGSRGLPHTAERALRLFASAIPLEAMDEARAVEALTAGGILYLLAGSNQPPQGKGLLERSFEPSGKRNWELVEVDAEATSSGARVCVAAARGQAQR